MCVISRSMPAVWPQNYFDAMPSLRIGTRILSVFKNIRLKCTQKDGVAEKRSEREFFFFSLVPRQILSPF